VFLGFRGRRLDEGLRLREWEIAISEEAEDFAADFGLGAARVVGEEESELLARLEQEAAVEGEKVAIVADAAEAIAPALVEIHAERRDGVIGSERRSRHGGESFRLENATALEFAAVEEGEGVAGHVGARGRDATGWRRKKDFEADRFLFGGAITFGWIDA